MNKKSATESGTPAQLGVPPRADYRVRSDDPNRAYRAADAWISRVHGRPKETVENVTTADDPLDVASMTREQRDVFKRELLRQHPELAERIAGLRDVD